MQQIKSKKKRKGKSTYLYTTYKKLYKVTTQKVESVSYKYITNLKQIIYKVGTRHIKKYVESTRRSYIEISKHDGQEIYTLSNKHMSKFGGTWIFDISKAMRNRQFRKYYVMTRKKQVTRNSHIGKKTFCFWLTVWAKQVHKQNKMYAAVYQSKKYIGNWYYESLDNDFWSKYEQLIRVRSTILFNNLEKNGNGSLFTSIKERIKLLIRKKQEKAFWDLYIGSTLTSHKMIYPSEYPVNAYYYKPVLWEEKFQFFEYKEWKHYAKVYCSYYFKDNKTIFGMSIPEQVGTATRDEYFINKQFLARILHMDEYTNSGELLLDQKQFGWIDVIGNTKQISLQMLGNWNIDAKGVYPWFEDNQLWALDIQNYWLYTQRALGNKLLRMGTGTQKIQTELINKVKSIIKNGTSSVSHNFWVKLGSEEPWGVLPTKLIKKQKLRSKQQSFSNWGAVKEEPLFLIFRNSQTGKICEDRSNWYSITVVQIGQEQFNFRKIYKNSPKIKIKWYVTNRLIGLKLGKYTQGSPWLIKWKMNGIIGIGEDNTIYIGNTYNFSFIKLKYTGTADREIQTVKNKNNYIFWDWDLRSLHYYRNRPPINYEKAISTNFEQLRIIKNKSVLFRSHKEHNNCLTRVRRSMTYNTRASVRSIISLRLKSKPIISNLKYNNIFWYTMHYMYAFNKYNYVHQEIVYIDRNFYINYPQHGNKWIRVDLSHIITTGYWYFRQCIFNDLVIVPIKIVRKRRIFKIQDQLKQRQDFRWPYHTTWAAYYEDFYFSHAWILVETLWFIQYWKTNTYNIEIAKRLLTTRTIKADYTSSKSGCEYPFWINPYKSEIKSYIQSKWIPYWLDEKLPPWVPWLTILGSTKLKTLTYNGQLEEFYKAHIIREFCLFKTARTCTYLINKWNNYGKCYDYVYSYMISNPMDYQIIINPIANRGKYGHIPYYFWKHLYKQQQKAASYVNKIYYKKIKYSYQVKVNTTVPLKKKKTNKKLLTEKYLRLAEELLKNEMFLTQVDCDLLYIVKATVRQKGWDRNIEFQKPYVRNQRDPARGYFWCGPYSHWWRRSKTYVPWEVHYGMTLKEVYTSTMDFEPYLYSEGFLRRNPYKTYRTFIWLEKMEYTNWHKQAYITALAGCLMLEHRRVEIIQMLACEEIEFADKMEHVSRHFAFWIMLYISEQEPFSQIHTYHELFFWHIQATTRAAGYASPKLKHPEDLFDLEAEPFSEWQFMYDNFDTWYKGDIKYHHDMNCNRVC